MCAAQSEAECGCSGVDWTPVEVYSLREDVNRLERENAALREDNLKAHQMACAAGLERDRLRDELAALRKAALALISELDVEAFDRVGRPKGEMLYEHVGPLRAAVNAARAKEGGAS
jgi:hypothetical protein